MKKYVCVLVIVSIFLPALARAEELSGPESRRNERAVRS